MSKNTKSILIGIVIGAIVLAGGQYAWSKYQAGVRAKDLSVSMQGLKAATNKTAYLNTLFTEKAKSSGISVGFSNSSADDGDLAVAEVESGSSYCAELEQYLHDLSGYIGSCRLRDPNCTLAYSYWREGLGYWNSGCR